MSDQTPQNYSFLPKSLAPLLRRITRPIKIPAWVAFAVAIYSGVPDFFGRAEWWLERASEARGVIPMIAAVILWPYFAPTVAVTGLLWLVFVGEPKQRTASQTVLVIGWLAAAILVAAILIAIAFGYTASIYGPRVVLPKQQERFDTAAKLPPGTKIVVEVSGDMGCPDCDEYANKISDLINSAPGWSMPIKGSIMGPNYRAPSGIAIMVFGDESDAQSRLCAAFDAAGIMYDIVKFPASAATPPPMNPYGITKIDVQLTVMEREPQ
jgi:hypothetical protein